MVLILKIKIKEKNILQIKAIQHFKQAKIYNIFVCINIKFNYLVTLYIVKLGNSYFKIK